MQKRNRRPEHLYLLPIGGTAMASLAGLLIESGHHVEGVDSQLYPPMSDLLAELDIPVRLGFDPAEIPKKLDRVIIGNAIGRDNVEVQAVLQQRIPHLSQAEAVASYVLGLGLKSIVVAGTHGKTTTSSLLAWILERTEQDPSYLIGGLLRWSGRSFRLGEGPWCVLEGDEYNSAFFDRGPKFLHYRPHIFVLGPVEFDHADLYPHLNAVLTAFRSGVAQVPRHGAVVVNGWSKEALTAVSDAQAPLMRVGESAEDHFRMLNWSCGSEDSRATVAYEGIETEIVIPLAGLHNLQNAMLALAAARICGVSLEGAIRALAEFPGVARRLEIVGEENGVLVIDDFAHHPTALGVTIDAARSRWPDRRLVVAFEPRSLTAARRDFQDAYFKALRGAAMVLVAPPYHRDRLQKAERLDRGALAALLADVDVQSVMPEADENVALCLLSRLRPGDVVIGCSSGSFEGFHVKLLDALRASAGSCGENHG